MKKLLLSVCLILGIISTIAIPAQAEEYYYEEAIEVIESSMTRATSTKTAKKTGSYKNSSGTVLWSVTVTGTFTYNGTTSSCTKSVVSTSVSNSNWKISSSSSSKSGNKATATATAKCFYDGPMISTTSKTVTLTCDKNGNLS